MASNAAGERLLAHHTSKAGTLVDGRHVQAVSAMSSNSCSVSSRDIDPEIATFKFVVTEIRYRAEIQSLGRCLDRRGAPRRLRCARATLDRFDLAARADRSSAEQPQALREGNLK